MKFAIGDRLPSLCCTGHQAEVYLVFGVVLEQGQQRDAHVWVRCLNPDCPVLSGIFRGLTLVPGEEVARALEVGKG